MAVLSVVALAHATSTSSAVAAEIRWEVANRFPLFQDSSQFAALDRVYRALDPAARRASPALNLEIELEKQALAKSLGPAFGNADALARFGWASAVVRKTCFDPGSRSYAGCPRSNGETYLTLSETDIAVSLIDGPADGSCVWKLNGVPAVTAPCAQAPVIIRNVPVTAPFDLSLAAPDGGGTDLSNQSIRTIVIAGMGDSFAAGEGNPDRPALFGPLADTYENSSRASRDPAFQRYPLRSGSSPSRFGSAESSPLWFNTQCHRSLYSHQLKAALQIALESKHSMVKYFGYACTGAEIEKGLLGYWSARDDIDRKRRDDAPQLMRILRDFCATRSSYFVYLKPKNFDWRKDIRRCPDAGAKIDAMLLTIGGNDIGFAKVISNEILHPENARGPISRARFKLWRHATGPISFKKARQNLSVLKTRYATLRQELADKVGLPPERVIHTGYPYISSLGNGGTCPAGTSGMDVHQILSFANDDTGETARAFVGELNGTIRSDVDWTFLDGFAARFKGHAICSGGSADGSTAPDGMAFPNKVGERWIPFAPSLWAPYTPRNRWFVTPNDAFLAANYMTFGPQTGGKRFDVVQPLLAATYGGSFHPNALGQAAIADDAAVALRTMLGLPAVE